MMSTINKERQKESKLFTLQGEKFIRLCETNGKVFIFEQKEIPIAGKYALCFEETDFWVDCLSSKKKALLKAKKLGLTIVS